MTPIPAAIVVALLVAVHFYQNWRDSRRSWTPTAVPIPSEHLALRAYRKTAVFYWAVTIPVLIMCAIGVIYTFGSILLDTVLASISLLTRHW